MNDKTFQEKYEKYEIIYSMHADTVYRACYMFLNDKELAQEVTTRTFVDIFKCFDELEEDKILSYLVCYAKRLSEQYLSK